MDTEDAERELAHFLQTHVDKDLAAAAQGMTFVVERSRSGGYYTTKTKGLDRRQFLLRFRVPQRMFERQAREEAATASDVSFRSGFVESVIDHCQLFPTTRHIYATLARGDRDAVWWVTVTGWTSIILK